MMCECKVPGRTEASSDLWQVLFGVWVWVGGEDWESCAKCDGDLGPVTKAAKERR